MLVLSKSFGILIRAKITNKRTASNVQLLFNEFLVADDKQLRLTKSGSSNVASQLYLRVAGAAATLLVGLLPASTFQKKLKREKNLTNFGQGRDENPQSDDEWNLHTGKLHMEDLITVGFLVTVAFFAMTPQDMVVGLMLALLITARQLQAAQLFFVG